jgi:PAS domain S-box-containing protein
MVRAAMRNQTLKSWLSAEQSLLGGMALASLAAACIWLVLGPAPDIADHLLAIALLVALFLGALIVMYLVGNSRREMQAALESRIRAEQRATETLRESETQWKEVFEHNPVMYFMVDADGIVLSVNSFGALQLGYPVSELRGASVLKVFFEEDREVVRKSVDVCLKNIGQTHSWEIRKIRKDRSALWVRENAKAVRRLDGRLIVLIACEDITERKEAENALRQSESYLAEGQPSGYSATTRCLRPGSRRSCSVFTRTTARPPSETSTAPPATARISITNFDCCCPTARSSMSMRRRTPCRMNPAASNLSER